MRQILAAMEGEIDSGMVIVGNFGTPLSPMDGPSRVKISKETQALDDTLHRTDLIDICGTFHPKTTEYTFFSGVHGTFARMDHVLGHRSSLGGFGKVGIVSSIFSDCSTMRLDINYRKRSVKSAGAWRLHNTLLSGGVITEEIKGEVGEYLKTNDSGDTMAQNLWDAAKAVLRGKFIAIQAYIKKQETSQINNLNLHLKELEKEEQNP